MLLGALLKISFIMGHPDRPGPPAGSGLRRASRTPASTVPEAGRPAHADAPSRWCRIRSTMAVVKTDNRYR
jgi:hypothetical protein